ncbi:MAG: hypothetical protein QFB86_00960 [Patescibacteria group bacterium]|nr:hypothetical protein [Patescibacteria group bacterium]
MAVIAFLMNYMFNQYGQLVVQNSQVNLQISAQSDVFSMQDDIYFANRFVSNLNTTVSDPYAPTGGWVTSSSPTVFIISTPALTASHRNPSKQAVFINTLGCSPQSTKEQNDILYNNIIYFVSGSNLYKRIVTSPSSTSLCGTSFLQPTCPAANATTSCAKDILITDQLQSFSVTYSDLTGATVTTPEQARLAKISLTLQDKAYAQNVSANTTVTLRRINQ